MTTQEHDRAEQYKARAERAEALLREIASDDRAFTNALRDCYFCCAYLDLEEAHDPDCPIARARALLAEIQP